MDRWSDAEMLRRMDAKLDLIERRIGHVGDAVFVCFAIQLVILIYLVWRG